MPPVSIILRLDPLRYCCASDSSYPVSLGHGALSLGVLGLVDIDSEHHDDEVKAREGSQYFHLRCSSHRGNIYTDKNKNKRQ